MLERIADGQAELVLPTKAVEELERILTVKLHLPSAQVTNVMSLVNSIASTVAETPAAVPALSGDPDDDMLIAAALAAGAAALVSGDRRHVLPLRCVGDMRILTPQAWLAEFSAR